MRAVAERPRLPWGSAVSYVKKSGWYLGQNLLHNSITDRAVAARTITRDDLFSGHPSVTECIRFGASERAQFRPPVFAGRLPETIANAPVTVSIERPFVFELEDVQLVGPYALSIPATGDIVLENALGWRRRVLMGSLQCVRSGLLPRRGRPGERYDVALSMVGPWCRNYFHWLIDYVTRLRAVEPYEDRTGRTPVLLLPHDSTEWMRSALELAGFDETDWQCFESDRATVDRLVVPSLARGISDYFDREGWENTYGLSPSAVRWLRETFRSHVDRSDRSGWPDRLYISRQNASERRVRNRAELDPVLEAYGFEPVHPEEHSLSEQVAMFSDAEAVMGPTGAGMVNSVFGEDLSVITLYGSDTHPIYYVLGSLLEFDLGCYQATPVGTDIRIDPDDLRTVLDGLDLD